MLKPSSLSIASGGGVGLVTRLAPVTLRPIRGWSLSWSSLSSLARKLALPGACGVAGGVRRAFSAGCRPAARSACTRATKSATLVRPELRRRVETDLQPAQLERHRPLIGCGADCADPAANLLRPRQLVGRLDLNAPCDQRTGNHPHHHARGTGLEQALRVGERDAAGELDRAGAGTGGRVVARGGDQNDQDCGEARDVHRGAGSNAQRHGAPPSWPMTRIRAVYVKTRGTSPP